MLSYLNKIWNRINDLLESLYKPGKSRTYAVLAVFLITLFLSLGLLFMGPDEVTLKDIDMKLSFIAIVLIILVDVVFLSVSTGFITEEEIEDDLEEMKELRKEIEELKHELRLSQRQILDELNKKR